ncbi:MAG: (cytosine-5)-methyltransferase 1, partial [Campylobacterota bacterium]|nr:(cytosine-5)-methyltransferase 1 [Campylobacterota bacterium]
LEVLWIDNTVQTPAFRKALHRHPKYRVQHQCDCDKRTDDYINDADFTANHAAAMIFVLNHNFNGLYNESKKGRFNGSFNWNAKRINYVDMSALIQQMHEILSTKNVEIYTMDVFELLHQFNDPDTFIYLDPPYMSNELLKLALRDAIRKLYFEF